MRPRALLRLAVAAPLLVAALAIAPRARADGALPADASPVQREQAQSRFLRGKDSMTKASYGDALAEFRASHDIVASPNTRLEIARCLLAMGNLVAAYAEFGRTAIEAKELIAEDNRYQRAYDSAVAEQSDLQPKLGFVALTIANPSEATRVTVGGEEIRRAAWTEPAPVTPGTTPIVVLTPGHAGVARSVTLAAGARTALTIDAQSGAPEGSASEGPAPEPALAPIEGPSHRAPLRTWAYVAGGVGVAGIATLAIFGALAHSTFDDLQNACGNGPCPASKADEISSGKTKETVANVGLALGIVGIAAGTTLFVFSLHKKGAASTDGPPASGGASSATGPALVVSPAWLGIRGTL